MRLVSAGILMWRCPESEVEILLGHFGGPMWRNKDAGAWAMPKGMIEPNESAEAAARREFREELGQEAEGELIPLGRIRQRGGKWVDAFALEGDFDPGTMVSNHFTMEWPPRSGRLQSFPELDAAAWFTLGRAREMILPSQRPIIDLFEEKLAPKE